MSKQISEDKL